MALKKNAEMKHMAMNLLKVGAVVLSAATLFACGDDSGNSSKASDSGNSLNETDFVDGREVESLADLGRCTSEREGDTVYVVEKLRDFVCLNHAWIDVNEAEIQNGNPNFGDSNESLISSDSFGFESSSASVDIEYLSSSSKKQEQETGLSSSIDFIDSISMSLGGCTTEKMNDIGNYQGEFYVCKNNLWRQVSFFEADTYGYSCLEDGRIVEGRVDVENKYVCDDRSFRKATDDEIKLDCGCTSYTEGKVDTTKKNSILIERWICSSEWNFERIDLVNDDSEFDVSENKLKDLRDGRTYRTVTIETEFGTGSQTWMAENLNYDYKEGSAQSYCCDQIDGFCEKYGRLYDWAAAMDSAAVFSEDGKNCGRGDKACHPRSTVRGVCPKGWHLPHQSDWSLLIGYLGRRSREMFLIDEWDDPSKCPTCSDTYGFSVLPAGGSCYSVGNLARFWASNEFSNEYGYSIYVYQTRFWYDGSAGCTFDSKNEKLSVRCVKDSD